MRDAFREMMQEPSERAADMHRGTVPSRHGFTDAQARAIAMEIGLDLEASNFSVGSSVVGWMSSSSMDVGTPTRTSPTTIPG